ncbi:MAG: penicillin-binding protein activator LpoB, partial [Treponema sp.]|nr:penicillin-binding protein activator LpoB [Treponema sp.]
MKTNRIAQKGKIVLFTLIVAAALFACRGGPKPAIEPAAKPQSARNTLPAGNGNPLEELNFQMSGEVDESTAQAAGRMVGAETIILGSFTGLTNM